MATHFIFILAWRNSIDSPWGRRDSDTTELVTHNYIGLPFCFHNLYESLLRFSNVLKSISI